MHMDSAIAVTQLFLWCNGTGGVCPVVSGVQGPYHIFNLSLSSLSLFLCVCVYTYTDTHTGELATHTLTSSLTCACVCAYTRLCVHMCVCVPAHARMLVYNYLGSQGDGRLPMDSTEEPVERGEPQCIHYEHPGLDLSHTEGKLRGSSNCMATLEATGPGPLDTKDKQQQPLAHKQVSGQIWYPVDPHASSGPPSEVSPFSEERSRSCPRLLGARQRSSHSQWEF